MVLQIYENKIENQKEIKFFDYSFSFLNSLSETNIKKIQVLQNSAVRFILKLKCNTPSNIVHHEALNILKLLTISNLLFELSERYVAGVLRHSVPMVVSWLMNIRRVLNQDMSNTRLYCTQGLG
ncbi:hypothetical protein BpHYR1_012670 [Brachionus plicatilis]|uniref:Uncharacterized protein n=1 Tax=Brachionus plicatilis TaxID=10195 RepID=A0A3M7Q5L4_BRAPC|nr:hypothetical protein BpHYR1_012670 [Brachionus plicatilis]